MSNIIQNKLHNILGDLARPTKFKCQIMVPAGLEFTLEKNESNNPIPISECLDYSCYAASFPGMTNEVYEMYYRGRKIPVRGIQSFSQRWTATFYCDEKHAIRRLFLDWIRSNQNFDYEEGAKDIKEVLSTISIYQQDFENANDTVVYTMFNVFPTNVSDMEVDYNNINQVSNFTVEFAYTHFAINVVNGKGLNSEEIKHLIGESARDLAYSALWVGRKKAEDQLSSMIKGSSIEDLVNQFDLWF